jgi:hypothetical protein
MFRTRIKRHEIGLRFRHGGLQRVLLPGVHWFLRPGRTEVVDTTQTCFAHRDLELLLAVPALREKYLGYVRDIAQNHLSWLVLGPVAERYHALIDADIKIDTRKLYSYEEFQTGLATLRRFVEQRRAYLLNYVAR